MNVGKDEMMDRETKVNKRFYARSVSKESNKTTKAMESKLQNMMMKFYMDKIRPLHLPARTRIVMKEPFVSKVNPIPDTSKVKTPTKTSYEFT